MKITDSYNKIFKNINRVLIVMAHPDDLEIYCGGTVSRLIADNKEVMSIKMNLGNKGSRQEQISTIELTKQRLNEDNNAMKVLGLKSENNIYLNFKDGEVENSLKTIERLAYYIRKFKPDLIITHNPEDKIIKFDSENSWINHRDHLNTGLSAIDAAYPYSRDILFFPEHFSDKDVHSHICTKFLLVDYYNHEDTISIEMTKYTDLRTKSIAAHSSQYPKKEAQESTDFFTNLDNSGKRYERFRFVETD